MSSVNEIRDLNKIYMEAVYGGGKKKEEPKDTRHVVTRADKVGNTPAYQKFKAGDKNYKAADHLKEDEKYGYDKKGNSLNPVDIEKRKKKEDDLAGSPKNEELQQIRALVEKEVKVKDTRRTVDAIRAYDKSKDASRDATYDTDEGDKEKAEIEKKYAAKERGEIDKDDPNWKKRKYHTGIHGEEVEALVASGKFSNEELIKITNLQEADIGDIIARLEKKRISKGGNPDDSPLPAMKKYHADKKKKAEKK